MKRLQRKKRPKLSGSIAQGLEHWSGQAGIELKSHWSKSHWSLGALYLL